MIIPFACNVFKFKKWITMCLVSICIVILSIKMYKIPYALWPSINQLTELEKCPACYGVSECNEIQTIDITPSDILSWISYLFGVKNVFFGTLNGTKIVVKKLAHTSELKAFDRMYNDLKNSKQSMNFHELIVREITLNFSNDYDSRLRLCPTTEHIDNLFHNLHHKAGIESPEIFELYLWTLLKINPEPLVLQILSAEDNWPVPKYIGACGRVIVEEYIGPPLSTYYQEPWILRAKLALSLLSAAHMFTFKNKKFGFYLTDISADNIAVDPNGVIKFIDVENIIVVDKNNSGNKPQGWFTLEENAADFDCTDCLIYSAADICSHQLSDHNYFSICKLLLSTTVGDSIFPGGLLHNMPSDISGKYPNLQDLIRQCVNPVPPHTRITIAHQLQNLIRTII